MPLPLQTTLALPAPGVPQGGRLSDVLLGIAGDTGRERISIADLAAAMSHRAFAALMLIFALPNVLPAPPGTSAVLGLPLVVLAAQLILGRTVPWLPGFIGRRSIARADFANLVGKAHPWLVRAERYLSPRASFLTRGPFERLIGLICFLLAMVLFLPIPLGNMLPAAAICLLSLAVLDRDALAAGAGVLVAGASVIVVWGVVYALAESLFLLLAPVLTA